MSANSDTDAPYYIEYIPRVRSRMAIRSYPTDSTEEPTEYAEYSVSATMVPHAIHYPQTRNSPLASPGEVDATEITDHQFSDEIEQLAIGAEALQLSQGQSGDVGSADPRPPSESGRSTSLDAAPDQTQPIEDGATRERKRDKVKRRISNAIKRVKSIRKSENPS